MLKTSGSSELTKRPKKAKVGISGNGVDDGGDNSDDDSGYDDDTHFNT